MKISKTVTIDIPTRPCPFCTADESRHNLGSEEGENEDGYRITLHYVYCAECMATGPKVESGQEQAIQHWNADHISTPAPLQR